MVFRLISLIKVKKIINTLLSLHQLQMEDLLESGEAGVELKMNQDNKQRT